MKWKPNKADAAEYGAKMREIEEFCKAHTISVSSSGDSYYFILNGTPYRVSNHTVSKSDSGMRDEFTGEKIRESYHSDESAETVYITAGKMRIIDIYNDLSAGIAIDGKGNRKDIS